jgi:hypothetical protein
MSKTIKFHLVQDFPEQMFLPPLPAKKTVPDWFKKIPPHNEDDETVKKCVPFIDAMSVGYTILNHIDISIWQMENGEVKIKWHDEHHKKLLQRWPPIETHPQRQVPGSPMTGYTILKYMSPWIIETPPDYSLLFLPPINRLEIPIVPLVGLVDCDTYQNNVNIPFIHTMLEPDEQIHHIPKGTPICQVVPVKRDAWKADYTFLDQKQLDKQKKLRTTINEDRIDWYKNHAHQKKRYD